MTDLGNALEIAIASKDYDQLNHMFRRVFRAFGLLSAGVDKTGVDKIRHAGEGRWQSSQIRLMTKSRKVDGHSQPSDHFKSGKIARFGTIRHFVVFGCRQIRHLDESEMIERTKVICSVPVTIKQTLLRAFIK
jgi:hypothetical protein